MVMFTQSLSHWLFTYHRKEYALIMFGHTELFTPQMQEDYLAWCATEEGEKYLQGGSEYIE